MTEHTPEDVLLAQQALIVIKALRAIRNARRLTNKIHAEELAGDPIHPRGCPQLTWTLDGEDDGYPQEYLSLVEALDDIEQAIGEQVDLVPPTQLRLA
jgi:hypothetical protein